MKKKHLVLLGDSTLDNKPYTEGGPAVSEFLLELLEPEWKVTLKAVDGHRIHDVYSQLERLPMDTTHLCMSVGGNDALSYSHILQEDSGSIPSVLLELSEITGRFANAYTKLIDLLQGNALPLVLCTIYEGAFEQGTMQRKANTALAGFNDIIIRTAIRHGLPLIDLRAVCSESYHFTQIIEPSELGGKNIADTIAHVIRNHDFKRRETVIYGSEIGSDTE